MFEISPLINKPLSNYPDLSVSSVSFWGADWQSLEAGWKLAIRIKKGGGDKNPGSGSSVSKGKEAWKYCIFVCLASFIGGGQTAKSSVPLPVLILLDLSATSNLCTALFLEHICHLASRTLPSFGSCSSSGYSFSVSSSGSLSFSWCLHRPEAECGVQGMSVVSLSTPILHHHPVSWLYILSTPKFLSSS